MPAEIELASAYRPPKIGQQRHTDVTVGYFEGCEFRGLGDKKLISRGAISTLVKESGQEFHTSREYNIIRLGPTSFLTI